MTMSASATGASFARAARRLFAAGCAAALLAACATPSSPTASFETALNGPQRSGAERARDVYRHPRATLDFLQVAPDQRVLEIAPGDGWYTDILAPYLRGHGELYEAQYIGPAAGAAEHGAPARERYRQKLAAMPSIYDKVVIGTLHNGQFEGFDAGGRFDRVLTFRNIHNWLKDGQLDANLRAFYAALKPGGELGIEEHRARPGTSMQQMIDTGYVTEALVIERARAAGFELAGRSEINANPADTKDYPHGVWSLPPTYAGGDVDRARYAAIGESDRMTLRFVKPR